MRNRFPRFFSYYSSTKCSTVVPVPWLPEVTKGHLTLCARMCNRKLGFPALFRVFSDMLCSTPRPNHFTIFSHIFPIFSLFSSVFSKSFHYFLLYFPNLITIQLTFHTSSYFPSIFSISFHHSTCLSSILSISFHYSICLSSIFSISLHNCLSYFPYLFTIFFHIFYIISLFNLLFFHIFHIFSLFNLLFFHFFPIFSPFNLCFFHMLHIFFFIVSNDSFKSEFSSLHVCADFPRLILLC